LLLDGLTDDLWLLEACNLDLELDLVVRWKGKCVSHLDVGVIGNIDLFVVRIDVEDFQLGCLVDVCFLRKCLDLLV
jgi:hypothetical protein